jgi:hypothetical protein
MSEILRNVFSEKIMEALTDFIDQRIAESKSPLVTDEVLEIKRTLALIHAKEYISISEAAYLLSCSPDYLRKLIKLARKGTAKKGRGRNPIPYRELDGLATFNREELLEWAKPQHLKTAT